MKALLLHRQAAAEEFPLHVADVPEPAPGPGQVRLRVLCCAVCRTDLHVVEGDLPPKRLPLVPGHQVVGVVEALGPRCRRLQPGQRVGAAWLGRTCGQCGYCTSGRENLCPDSLYTGYHFDGGYAEQMIAWEDFLYPLPEEPPPERLAPLLCAGIIGYRSLQRARVPAGGRLLLVGFGSSAHLVLPLAKARGLHVAVLSRTPEHQRLARQLGADWAGADPAELPWPADGAILFAPAGQLVPVVLERLAPGGTLAVAGIHLSPIPSLDYQRHLYWERDLRSVTSNTRADGQALLEEALAAGVRPQVQLFPLEQANQALLALKQGRVQGTAVLCVAPAGCRGNAESSVSDS